MTDQTRSRSSGWWRWLTGLGALVVIAFLTTYKFTGGPVETGRYEAGRIMDATVLPTRFHEVGRIQVKTDKYVFVIFGNPVIPLGKPAIVVTTSAGRSYLTWSDTDRMWMIP